MKKIILAALFFSSEIYVNAQPIFQWAKEMPATGSCDAKSMTLDAAGNVIITGVMRGTVDFDPGPGIFNLTSAGQQDIYTSKLDPNGNFVWAKRIGGASVDQGESVTTDAAGNVYVTGWFSAGQIIDFVAVPSDVDFDPGPGVFNLSDLGLEAFVLKLDADGNFVWAKSIEGVTNNSSEYGKAVAVDAVGNLFITGAFMNTVDFDSGPGSFTLTAQGASITDIFLTKWDAASGNLIWAKQMGGIGSDYPNEFWLDATGNVFITGYFFGTADFDPGAGVFNLISAGGADIFVSKLNNDGDFIWAKRWGANFNDEGYGISTDLAGNVYTATFFTGTFDADPGAGIFDITATGVSDVFICKLNAAGDFQWAKTWGAQGSDRVYDIKTDAAGNVYTGGTFGNIVDFDPGPAEVLLTASGGSDLFYSKFDGNGNFIWAVKLDGGGGEIQSMQINAANQIFSTGLFGATIDFDPGAGIFNLTATSTDIFVHKLSQSGVLPLTLLNFSATVASNGNVLHWQTAQEINTQHFEIEWSDNRQTFEKIAVQKAAGNSTAVLNYSYTHSMQVSGPNYYRLKMVDIDGHFTYSKTVQVNTTLVSFAISAFPNPVINFLELKIKALKAETVLFYVHAADGKLIAQKSFKVIKGNNLFNWNMQSVAAGNYFISSGNHQFNSVMIIKQ